MKSVQLQELIKLITQKVLKEYSLLSSDKEIDNSDTTDPNVNQMTSSQKIQLQRKQTIDKQKQIKQKEEELKTKKKEMDFQKKKADQTKRFDIPNISKDLQRLKGSKL